MESQVCLKKAPHSNPLFVYSVDDVKDQNGIKRYYAEPVKYNDVDIYVCSQWFENDRKKLVPWLKKKME